jgi:hypothetical protein
MMIEFCIAAEVTIPFTSIVPFMVVFELIAARCASTIDKASPLAAVSVMAPENESPKTAFCSVINVFAVDVEVKLLADPRSYVGAFILPSTRIVFVANCTFPDLVVEPSLYENCNF